jgi:hypothetical protein
MNGTQGFRIGTIPADEFIAPDPTSWLPESPTLGDIALCLCLITGTTRLKRQQQLVSSFHQRKVSAIGYYEVSVIGHERLAGMDESSLVILLGVAKDFVTSVKEKHKVLAYSHVVLAVATVLRGKLRGTRLSSLALISKTLNLPVNSGVVIGNQEVQEKNHV